MLTPLCGPQELWKTLKEMGVSDHFTCLLRNLYAGQEGTVRTGHGKTGSTLRKNTTLYVVILLI